MSTYSKCTSGQYLQDLARQQKIHSKPATAVRCPDCHTDFDVIYSRKAITKPSYVRAMFSFYRCRVCEYRFCEPKLALNVVMLGIVLALAGGLIWALFG